MWIRADEEDVKGGVLGVVVLGILAAIRAA